jgi:hypothetical protein
MSDPFKDLPEATLDALIAQERSQVVAPVTEWRTLSAQLRAEGLIRTADAGAAEPSLEAGSERHTPVPRRRLSGGMRHWGLRVAAGAALLGTGVVIGLGWSVGTAVAAAVKERISTEGSSKTVANADTTGRDSMVAFKTFTSPEAAKQVLLKSQSEYQRAAAYLVASDTSPQIVGDASPAVYQLRLAGLDVVVSATQRALKDAPHDLVLNQYYQSSVGAREATVQQLAQALPVGTRVSRY